MSWRPFIDPLNVVWPGADNWWFLFLIPVSFGIALAYKAVRAKDMKRYPQEVVVMTGQIVLGMILLGVASYVFLQWVLPLIAPME